MTRSEILTRLTALSSTHESVLGNIRSRSLRPQPSTPFDPSRPLLLDVTLSPDAWRTAGRIEQRGAEIDALFADARRELGFSGDMLAEATARHQGTPERISEGMASLNADIASLTAALAAKSVTFVWASLPSR
jgi:hypothetical protein